MTLFEMLLAILSVSLTVETVLALVIYLCVGLSVSFSARKQSSETPSPMILEVLAALPRGRRWLWFWWALLFFPLGCVSPVYQGLRWLSYRSPSQYDLLAKCCLITLAFLFGRAVTLQEISASIWCMCLFWMLVITETSSNGDDREEQGGREGEEGPDDPTPNGDAAERWLHTRHSQPTDSSTH